MTPKSQDFQKYFVFKKDHFFFKMYEFLKTDVTFIIFEMVYSYPKIFKLYNTPTIWEFSISNKWFFSLIGTGIFNLYNSNLNVFNMELLIFYTKEKKLEEK